MQALGNTENRLLKGSEINEYFPDDYFYEIDLDENYLQSIM